MIRFGFSIRTKSGQRVDNVRIMAATRADAERRLRQMYQQCVIVERREHAVADPTSIRDEAPVNNRIDERASARKTGTE
jgi:hypothetical protein